MCIIITHQQYASAVPLPTGIIVPLYLYPDATWNQLIKEKQTHPSVPVIAIINPDNGPGVQDPNYAMGIEKLQSAGITVLGYVYTQNTTITTIINYINDYKNWYKVNGIFFDQMSYVSGNETFYKHLSDYSRSIGLSYTVGNPGTDTLPSYIGTVDNIVIYDNPGLPSISSLDGWHSNFNKTNFSIISYGIDNINQTYVKSAAQYVQYMYISNSTLPNPFNTLSSYLDDLVATLDVGIKQVGNPILGGNAAVKPSYGQQPVGTIEIDLMSVSGERADYHGMALKIYQDNTNLPFKTIDSISGNPYNISLPLGHRYKIEVYASSMLASIGYVDLESSQKLELGIPNPGSFRFNVVYNDGITPINNATVMVKSTDGTYEYWTNSTTDNTGNTVRFWLQPTISNDNYYVADVLIGNDLSYSYYPISVLPGLSSDLKIITPWPTVLPPLTASVYKSNLQKVSKSDGDFVVRLYDGNGNKVAESKVDAIGEAYFSNLKVGKYIFRVIDLNNSNNEQWETTKILDGSQTSVQIFKDTSNVMAAQDSMIAAPDPPIPQNNIPIWVRENAKWWAQDQIGDSDFISGIKYMIQDGIVKIPTTKITSDSSLAIPSWIKSNASWWAQGQISDGDFIKGIQYLISNGIMKINHYSALMLVRGVLG